MGDKSKKKTLAEELQCWRCERPDEWKMDEFIREAQKLIDELEECKLSKMWGEVFKNLKKIKGS
jgi:hypothetical protein